MSDQPSNMGTCPSCGIDALFLCRKCGLCLGIDCKCPDEPQVDYRALCADLVVLLSELNPVLMDAFPKRGHDQPCGPEAGCDATCMDIARLADLARRLRAALARYEEATKD